jgi:chloramphenicol 3-O-phosphotransferase
MGPQPIQFRPVVSQQELSDIVARRAAIAFQMQTLTRSEESVLMRLVRGADIEPGIHQAWLQEAVKGRMRKQILEVR